MAWLDHSDSKERVSYVSKICNDGVISVRIRFFGAEARLATVGNYVILFRIRQDTVRIERVVHGGQEFVTVLGGTGS
jgi:hypothetical protein